MLQGESVPLILWDANTTGDYMEDQLGANAQESAEPATNQPSEKEIQTDNWRETRDLLKEQKAAIGRLERENAEQRAMLAQAFYKPPVEEEDDEIDVYSEDFGKKLQRKVERSVERAYENIEKRRKSDPDYLEAQARKQFSDFDEVMTQEHIDSIIKSDPLMHKTIMSSPEPLVAAYKYIKRSADYAAKQQPLLSTDRRVEENKAALTKNLAAPKSPNSAPRSQAISSVHGFGRLTAEQAKEIHAETMRIVRGR